MARKKQEIALQTELDNQEQWEDFMKKEGLAVIDVFQDWCGPCKAMQSFFRRLKNETGDDLLLFGVAKADTIDSLERYRGKCEPTFLLYGSGNLVSVIRGANPPVIERTIRQQLEHEHKVLKGEAERSEYRDPAFAYLDDIDKDAGDDEEEIEEIEHEVTVALIKPDAVLAGKVEEIIEELTLCGIEVLEHQERQLTEDEAREFYSHLQEEGNEEFFENLVTFMASGPSHVLVLGKGDAGVIQEFRDLLGPPSVEEAKENAPESLRAKFGTETFQNALHGADSEETAAKELAFFFPEFAKPKTRIAKKKTEESKPSVQRTMALIRPDAYAEFKEQIIAKIRDSGFKIAMQKEIQLTKERAEEFYSEHQGQDYFDELTNRMSNGPLLALCLARQDAIAGWRQMLGDKDPKKAKEENPESLRAQFAKDDIPINLIHGTDSEENVEKELRYFFPVEQTVAAIKPDAYENKDEIMDKIKEAGFHIAARKETKLSDEMAREFYKDVSDKEYYGDLINHMTDGETLFLVLSREDAVEGWRSVIGPTDPQTAVDVDADTIRAIYGTDVKSNAVHGASNMEHASKNMSLIFGDLQFSEEGELTGGEGMAAVLEEEERRVAAEEEKKKQKEEEEKEKAGEEDTARIGDGEERVVLDAEEAVEGEEGAAPKEGEEGAAEGQEGAAEGQEGTEGGAAPAEGAAEGEEGAPAAEGDAAAPAEEGEATAEGQEGGEAAPAEGQEGGDAAPAAAEGQDGEAAGGDQPEAASAEEGAAAPAEDAEAAAEPAPEAAAEESTDKPATPAPVEEAEKTGTPVASKPGTPAPAAGSKPATPAPASDAPAEDKPATPAPEGEAAAEGTLAENAAANEEKPAE